jgi:hypothetical protein
MYHWFVKMDNDPDGWIECDMDSFFMWKDMAETGMFDAEFAVSGLQPCDWLD